MSKVIPITNGEVTIKDFATRGLKKKINQILFNNVSVNGEGKPEGFTMQALDNANDTVVLEMIEKAVIDSKEVEVNQKFIDELNSKDFDKIFVEVDKITKAEVPKV